MSRHRSIAIAFFALALTALPALASAQQPPQIVRPYPRHDLVSATRQLAAQAAYEQPQGRFARVAERLAREAQDARAYGDHSRFEAMYVRARRVLLRGGRHDVEPSDALLDAWDRVVAAYAPIRHAPVHQPPQPPPPAPVAYDFEGSFEQTPVRLRARSLEELDAACMQFTSAMDLRYVDDVTIAGTPVHNGPSYWDARALCSIVVLNSSSRMMHVGSVHGSIEGLPFSIGGSRDVIERTLRIHLPRLVQNMRVDDVVVNGQAYHNGPSYWSAEQILSLIVSQLPPGPYAQGAINRW